MFEKISQISPIFSFFTGLLLLPLMFVSVFFWRVSVSLDNKEFLELLFSATVPIGILVALLTYFYNKHKDQKLEIGEQMSYIREILIPKQDLFIKRMQDMGIEIVRHNFSESDLESILTNDKSVKNIFKKQYPVMIKNKEIREISVTVLNMLEEFSLRIIHNKMLNVSALNIVHSVFVHSVESHFLTMLYLREIEYNRPIFKHTLKVYYAWKDKIERDSVDSRMQGSWKHVTQ
jgi:hypothetical protein